MVVTKQISLSTQGYCDFHNITQAVADAVKSSGVQSGIVTVFTPSATSALTTVEYESGMLQDFERLMEEIAAQKAHYQHNERWHDGNGFSHVRAALLGPSVTVPFVAGKLTLGTWQEIAFIDFDDRNRRRELVVQIMGE